MLEFVTLAVSLAANPFALAGYIALGVYSTSWLRAVRYGLLWGLAVQIFVLALGKANILDVEALAVQTGLRLVGAVLITLAVYSLYGLLRERDRRPPPPRGPGPGPGAGPGNGRGPAPRRRPHLRRVK